MLEMIHHWDTQALKWIGESLFHPFFGWMTRILTDPEGAVLLSIVAMVVLIIEKGRKDLAIALHILLVVGITNTISSEILKSKVNRPRPCVETGSRHFTPSCGDLSASFPSSHSANSMAIAVAALGYSALYGGILVVMSLLIGFSRLYLGIHYPSDVLVGWMLGAFIAWLLAVRNLDQISRPHLRAPLFYLCRKALGIRREAK